MIGGLAQLGLTFMDAPQAPAPKALMPHGTEMTTGVGKPAHQATRHPNSRRLAGEIKPRFQNRFKGGSALASLHLLVVGDQRAVLEFGKVSERGSRSHSQATEQAAPNEFAFNCAKAVIAPRMEGVTAAGSRCNAGQAPEVRDHRRWSCVGVSKCCGHQDVVVQVHRDADPYKQIRSHMERSEKDPRSCCCFQRSRQESCSISAKRRGQ